mgnify:CR=1 FL=1|jgi:hypothetical protein
MIDPQDRINYASQYLKWHEMKRIADDSYNRVAIAAIQDVVIESHLSQDQRDILLGAMEALGATGSDYLTICRRLVNGS